MRTVYLKILVLRLFPYSYLYSKEGILLILFHCVGQQVRDASQAIQTGDRGFRKTGRRVKNGKTKTPKRGLPYFAIHLCNESSKI